MAEARLTAMLIGLLFVLLAADVDLADIKRLGTAGLWVVATLICVVRPLNVLAGTYGSGLTWRQKTFLAWIGPRGIVAAAIASLFAVELERSGLEGGPELRALVFLVIGATVLQAGVTGGIASRLLSLRRASDEGWVILGANELARAVGRALQAWNEDVVLIDTNPHHCTAAEREGLRVIHGNGLEPRTLHRASIDTRAGALGLSTNSQVNLSFADRAKDEGKLARRFAGVGRSQSAYNLKTAQEQDTRVAFGQPIDLEHWAVRLRRGDARAFTYEWDGTGAVEGAAKPPPGPRRDLRPARRLPPQGLRTTRRRGHGAQKGRPGGAVRRHLPQQGSRPAARRSRLVPGGQQSPRTALTPATDRAAKQRA